MPITADAPATVRNALAGAWTPHAGGETPDELVVDSGIEYRLAEPVSIRITRRGPRYDLSDDGGAVERAGRPPGWRDALERVVATEGFNVNRRGVLFVPVVSTPQRERDIAVLVVRLAECSRRCYLTLLELQGA